MWGGDRVYLNTKQKNNSVYFIELLSVKIAILYFISLYILGQCPAPSELLLL